MDIMKEYTQAPMAGIDDVYTIHGICPGVTLIEDATPTKSCIYLIEGTECAIVIDTGSPCGGDFFGMLRKLTDLPLKLIVTHGHPDHAAFLDKTDEFHMSAKDIPTLTALDPGSAAYTHKCINIGESTVFNTGDTQIRVIAAPGHTPGSLLFADIRRRLVFCGDAFGSGEGVWMQITNALNMSDYRSGIRHALARIDELFGDEEITFLPGHIYQSLIGVPGFPVNPIDKALLADMADLCTAAIDGSFEAVPVKPDDRAFSDEPVMRLNLRRASCVCLKSRFR